MKVDIIEEVRKFVENECRKPTAKYGYDAYQYHFVSVHKYAKMLAEKLGADIEIVELAAWLHDIGSIIYGRENHHVTGAKVAEEKLNEMDYPKEKAEKIKQCILAHRGSQNIQRDLIEAQIIADADGMAHFDNLSGIFQAAFIYENQNVGEARKSTLDKLNRAWNKLSLDAQKIVEQKYLAAEVLLK